MARHRASIHATLLGLGFLCAAPAGAQLGKPPGGGFQGTQPVVPKEFIPDLVISSVKATATCTDHGTVTAKIVATVKNQSPKGTADLSKVPWNIVVEVTSWTSTTGSGNLEKEAKTVKPQAGGPKTLKPGESWNATLEIAGIPKFKTSIKKQGQYSFLVRADPMSVVGESDEKNNDKPAYVMDPCFKP
jgi:hypothetical protein